MKNRYFIVMYVAKSNTGHIINQGHFETNGHYLSLKGTIDFIRKGSQDAVTNIAITNIIELSKSDYEDWNK